MVSDSLVPWHNRPARPFPVHLWMMRRYGFRLPPLRFNPPASQPDGPRPFPAKLWVEQQRRAGS